MDNLINKQEIIIDRGIRSYRTSDIELQKLKETSTPTNPNYITVLKRIPEYFKTNNLFSLMLLAFNYGEMKGRKCERDMIKWNASAIFGWMKLYHKENGCFPDTETDLWEWEKEFVKELEEHHNILTEDDNQERLQDYD